MFELLKKLAQREDINLCILPHPRGMNRMKPPKELKDAWDSKLTLNEAVKESEYSNILGKLWNF